MSKVYEQMLARYTVGEVPWDSPTPPPEVMDLAEGLKPGRALDLGCGYGRTSIYLAQQWWQVDGVDFVAPAIAEAKRRAKIAGVTVNFQQADVSNLAHLAGPYHLAVDVGCAHALNEAQLKQYRDELLRLLDVQAYFLLFARLADTAKTQEDGPRGVDEGLLRAIFADSFGLEKEERGLTSMADGGAWASGWFWFRRKD